MTTSWADMEDDEPLELINPWFKTQSKSGDGDRKVIEDRKVTEDRKVIGDDGFEVFIGKKTMRNIKRQESARSRKCRCGEVFKYVHKNGRKPPSMCHSCFKLKKQTR